MTTKRKIVFTIIAVCLILSSGWVIVDTIGMNLKWTETRSVKLAHQSIGTLVDQGVILPETVNQIDLSFSIKQPIKDEIHMVQQRYLWTSPWMFCLGIILIVVAWFPGKSRSNSHG